MTCRLGTGKFLRYGLSTAALLLAAAAQPLEAQQPHWLGFRGDLGAEVPRGSAGDLFQGNVRGEFSLLIQPKPFVPFYVGFGFGWTTFHVKPPHESEPWNSVGSQFFVGLPLGKWLPIPLYVEGRVIERRLRPMDERFWDINSDDYILDRPFPQFKGFGVEGVVGLQLPLTGRTTYVDVGARVGQFRPKDVVFQDPVFVQLPDVTGGWTLGLQLGIVWFP